ncbi:hypothetical protein L4D00_17840 [Photobacterium swingsii]|uniref:Uncharacterized protein n=1 Tax=Photobacterium swingsii TaxID=680026 RepID=A0A0J8V9B2_9GAMM|nr:hypothetical protein [Photobacterium swingsii]KMV30023.1 hypothetical protein AB733_13920 [Photobacterium swingsii]PSW22945.1 hypothetical protein C9I94_17325 [Photobacterium swingsii]
MNDRTVKQQTHAPTPEQYPLALAISKEIESLECLGCVSVDISEDYSQIMINHDDAKQGLTLQWSRDCYITECDGRTDISGVAIRSASCAGIFAFAYDISLSLCASKAK